MIARMKKPKQQKTSTAALPDDPLPSVSVLAMKLLGVMIDRDQLREENERLKLQVAAHREDCRRGLCQKKGAS